MQGTAFRACANAVAYGECEWAMPPQENARYSSRCVGVSDEGRSLPASTRPVSRDTATRFAGVSCSYGTPLGLITNRPAARSTPDTLPNVSVTRPLSTSAWFARWTRSHSSLATRLTTALVRAAGAAASSAMAGHPAPRRLRRSCRARSEEHTSELQSRGHLVCRLLLEKKKT